MDYEDVLDSKVGKSGYATLCSSEANMYSTLCSSNQGIKSTDLLKNRKIAKSLAIKEQQKSPIFVERKVFIKKGSNSAEGIVVKNDPQGNINILIPNIKENKIYTSIELKKNSTKIYRHFSKGTSQIQGDRKIKVFGFRNSGEAIYLKRPEPNILQIIDYKNRIKRIIDLKYLDNSKDSDPEIANILGLSKVTSSSLEKIIPFNSIVKFPQDEKQYKPETNNGIYDKNNKFWRYWLNAAEARVHFLNKTKKSIDSPEKLKHLMDEMHNISTVGSNGTRHCHDIKKLPASKQGTFHMSEGLNSKRKDENQFVKKVAKVYGDKYDPSQAQLVNFSLINGEEHLPINLLGRHIYPSNKAGNKDFHLYTNSIFKYFDKVQKEKIEFLNLKHLSHNSELKKDRILTNIAKFYRYAINARPYPQINQSLIMNIVNATLSKFSLNEISHGYLDHIAHRITDTDKFVQIFKKFYEMNSAENFHKFIEEEYKKVA